MKTTIHLDGFEGWSRRALSRARDVAAGRPLTPSRGITFENAAEMVRILTPLRIELFQAVRKTPASVTDLASKLGRNVRAVRRDVSALERAGIVIVRAAKNPGHGQMRVVSAPSALSISAEL